MTNGYKWLYHNQSKVKLSKIIENNTIGFFLTPSQKCECNLIN